MGEYSLDELAMVVVDGTLSRSRALKALLAAVLSEVFSIFALPSRNANAAPRRQLTTFWAVVDANGNLVRGKGAVRSERLAQGFYRVTFDRKRARLRLHRQRRLDFLGRDRRQRS